MTWNGNNLATIQPGDQLDPLDFVTPGFRGLNTVEAGSLMDPGFCTQAQNAVIDTSGRLAARNGLLGLTYENFTIQLGTAPAVNQTSNTIGFTWGGPTTTVTITFATGEIRKATVTSGANTISWSGGLTKATTTLTATIEATAFTGIQFTAALASGAQSGALTANWGYATGNYIITFGTGEQRTATLTKGSTAVTWTVQLSSAEVVYAVVDFSVQSIFQYNQGGGVYQTIAAFPGTITNNTQYPLSTAGNITGSVSAVNGRWFFQNFNNKCIGLQNGQAPIVYTGTGTFTTVSPSAGTAPTGGIGCAAFGRLWVVGSDLQTIQYSGLLDETDWSTTDGNAGVIDMHTIWSAGTDQVTAIFAWNASLVVCGTNHIIFFTDGRGSLLGMDPTQAYVFDMLTGTGCISQWTVAPVGESDILFLSPNGVQSLQRLTTSRNNPVETLSKYNRDTLLIQLQTETLANVSGCFNSLTGFYILGFPVNGVTWCFDQRRNYQDDVGALCSVTTTWTMATTACATNLTNQALYIARANQGSVCVYSGYSDENSTYQFAYTSPWMNLGQQVSQRIKLLKRLSLTLFTAGNTTFTASWAADFGTGGGTFEQGSTTQTVSNYGTLSQYGLGQYGVSQYGGGTNLYIWRYAARLRGQYMQLGLSVAVSGVFALQQAQFAAKIGRIS